MESIEKEINKIKNYKTWTERRKIDALLRIDADMYVNLGKESTLAEKREVKRMSKKIYTAIRDINPTEGFILRAHMDEAQLK